MRRDEDDGFPPNGRPKVVPLRSSSAGCALAAHAWYKLPHGKETLKDLGLFFIFLIPRPPVRMGSLCLRRAVGFVLLRCAFCGLLPVSPRLFLI